MLNKFQLGYSKSKFANIILLLIIVLGIVVSVAPLSAVFASESLADSQNSEQNPVFTYTQSDENVSDTPFLSDTSTSTVRGITMTIALDVFETTYKANSSSYSSVIKVVGRITTDKKFKKRHSDVIVFAGSFVTPAWSVYIDGVKTPLERKCIKYDAKGNSTHYDFTKTGSYNFPSINPNETLYFENYLVLHTLDIQMQIQYLNLSKVYKYISNISYPFTLQQSYNQRVCFDRYVSTDLTIYPIVHH